MYLRFSLTLSFEVLSFPTYCDNYDIIDDDVDGSGAGNPYLAVDDDDISYWYTSSTSGWWKTEYQSYMYIKGVQIEPRVISGSYSATYDIYYADDENTDDACGSSGWIFWDSGEICDINNHESFEISLPGRYMYGFCIYFFNSPGSCSEPNGWQPAMYEIDFLACDNGLTPTRTPTRSPTNTPSPSRTSTQTSTQTPTGTTTETPTNSPTQSPTATLSKSLSVSVSETPSVTSSESPVSTPTGTPTNTPTETRTSSETATGSTTQTPSTTETPTETLPPLASPSNTPTSSATYTFTESTTRTASPTFTFTETNTPTGTPTGTPSNTPTQTPTKTSSNTPTETSSETPTGTPSESSSSSESQTPTGTTTETPTSSTTNTPTISETDTPTGTPTSTPTSSRSGTVTGTSTQTGSKTQTPTKTVSPTRTVSHSNTPSSSESGSLTVSKSLSSTITQTVSPTYTPTTTRTNSPTPSKSSSPTNTLSPSITSEPSSSISITPTSSPSPVLSPTNTPNYSAIVGVETNDTLPLLSIPKSFSPSISSTSSISCIRCQSILQPNRIVGATTIVVSSSELSVDVTIPNDNNDFPENSEVFVDIVQIIDYESVGLISTEAVDITAFTPRGEPITKFTENVEICLSVPENVDRNDACLSFLNENNEWECQDECLDSKTNARGEKALCGETDHFTTFALLFSIDGEDCNNDNQDLNATLGWLTLALVILAICIVMIAVGGIEIVYRKQRWQLNKQLKAAGISKLMQQKAGTSL